MNLHGRPTEPKSVASANSATSAGIRLLSGLQRTSEIIIAAYHSVKRLCPSVKNSCILPSPWKNQCYNRSSALLIFSGSGIWLQTILRTCPSGSAVQQPRRHRRACLCSIPGPRRSRSASENQTATFPRRPLQRP